MGPCRGETLPLLGAGWTGRDVGKGRGGGGICSRVVLSWKASTISGEDDLLLCRLGERSWMILVDEILTFLGVDGGIEGVFGLSSIGSSAV